jgi:hypothetical protein
MVAIAWGGRACNTISVTLGMTANNAVPSATGGRITGRHRRLPTVPPVTVTSRHRLLPPPSVTVTNVTAYVLVTASTRQNGRLPGEGTGDKRR